jgi:hypothetical protein
MYGYTHKGVQSKSDAIFDPDFFRSPDIQVDRERQFPGPQDVISSSKYVRDGGIASYHFHKLKTIYCLRNVYEPVQIRLQSQDKNGALNAAEEILEIVQKDRSNTCSKIFCSYIPGFSPKEHMEKFLQDSRERDLQEFQFRQNELFLQLEKTAADRDTYWKNREQNDRTINIVLSIIAIVVTFVNFLLIFLSGQ